MDLPLSLTVRGQWEKHRSRAAGSPWTLFGNADEWRPQPLVAEGELASVLLETEIDTRSDPDDPAWGWLATLEVERSVGMHLEMPQSVQVLSLPAPPEAAPLGEFTTAFIDIRRYNRVSPDGRLNFRLVAGGALTDGPLPPQRQHALGGEGSLPGYRLFDLDCGARSRSVQRRTAATPADGSVDLERPIFFPAYGCDRFGLFQAEYRGRLRFRFDWGCRSVGRRWGWRRGMGAPGGVPRRIGCSSSTRAAAGPWIAPDLRTSPSIWGSGWHSASWASSRRFH